VVINKCVILTTVYL